MRYSRQLVYFGIAAVISFAGIGCGKDTKPTGDGSPTTGSNVRISGGGATFVDPIMQRWSSEYKTIKGVEIDYAKTGSGNGIKQTTEQTLQFGCTDAPMTKSETEAAGKKGGEIVHLPVTMGAVAIAYNLPTLKAPLKLNGPVLAEIYLGTVTKWNDAKIAELNPGVSLPAQDITPVYRSDSSGTTNIFTEYLTKVSPAFAQRIGTSKAPKWPKIGTGQQGSDGIAGFVQRNEGSIGYVELFYARQNKIPYASMKNKAGKDVMPTAAAVTAAAAESIKEKPTREPYSLHQLTFSLTDSAGDASYPICGASYAILYKKQPETVGAPLKAFLIWAVTEGQKFAEELDYAPLPESLRSAIKERLGSLEMTK